LFSPLGMVQQTEESSPEIVKISSLVGTKPKPDTWTFLEGAWLKYEPKGDRNENNELNPLDNEFNKLDGADVIYADNRMYRNR